MDNKTIPESEMLNQCVVTFFVTWKDPDVRKLNQGC